MPGEIGGALLGMGMGFINDERQLNQNSRMRKRNMVYDKQWAQYMQDMQLKMWEATGYKGQMKQLEEAGLNPALLYGMGGAGGQSTGAPTAQTHTQPSNQGEIGMGIMAAQQSALIRAQTENIKAQTQKTDAERDKLETVDTEAVRAGIEQTRTATEMIFQQHQNLRQDHTLKELEVAEKNIRNYELQASQTDRLRYIKYNTENAEELLDKLKRENKIGDATYTDSIKQIRAEASTAVLVTKLTQEGINLSKEQQKAIAQGVLRDWDKFSMDKSATTLDNMLKGANIELTEMQKMNLLRGLDFIIGNMKK